MHSESGSLAIDLPALGGLPWYQRRILANLTRLRRGSLQVRFANGRSFRFRGAEAGPDADILVARPVALLRRLAWRGDLGFAESFIAGDWQTDDLASLLEVLARNLDTLEQTDARHRVAQVLIAVQHWMNRNSRSGSRRNIAAHYDLGNDFYAQWLDASMTYSAALFDRGGDLSEAQQRKYQRMFEQIDPLPGEVILEIGCGWGGFAEYAARRGCRVIGLTLSRAQLDYARRRLEAAGLAELVDLRLCDYRDFAEPVDHVVSIEMFEAVGKRYWQEYFATLARSVRPGGRIALQVITIDEAHFPRYEANPGGFIQTYIFPGGMLPSRTHLQTLADQAGLESLECLPFGVDYAETLAHWHATFNSRTDWLEQHGYDARFRRMWRYYLAFCEAGFRARQIDVVQCLLRRPR